MAKQYKRDDLFTECDEMSAKHTSGKYQKKITADQFFKYLNESINIAKTPNPEDKYMLETNNNYLHALVKNSLAKLNKPKN